MNRRVNDIKKYQTEVNSVKEEQFRSDAFPAG